MKLTRRFMLKGIGGSMLALPFLESLAWPRAARAQSQSVEPFAIFLRQANGVACEQGSPLADGGEPERFWPRSLGALTPESLQGRALDELTEQRSKLLVVRNVNMYSYDYGDGHARGALQGMTARGPTQTGRGGNSEASGESLDNRIGRELNPDGRDSLFFYAGQNSGWLGGACISYRGPGERRAAQINPKTVYDTLIGAGSGMTEEAATLLRNRQKSINDLVRDQMQQLMSRPQLSSADKQKLQLHFDSIRELEVSLECRLNEERERALDEPEASFFESTDGDEVIATAKLQMDVAVLALACGQNRSVAIQVGNGNDGITRYRNLDNGEPMENYHFISHRRASHDDSGGIIANSDVLHHQVDRQFARLFRYLIQRLEAYDMGDGTRLLDHGIAVWYNDNANGPAHSPSGVPYVIAGSANGFLKQGQCIEVAGGENHNQMLNTLGSAVGLRNANGDMLDDFGDPAREGGVLSELLV